MRTLRIAANPTYVRFQETILNYYRRQGRKFPWRETRDPYAILIAEVMLQQTQVERVVPFFGAWMKKFPTVRALAKAPLKEALMAWQGLGYNRRALNLKRTAEMILRNYDGKIPRNVEKIDALPGIGPYTARAIAAFAFGTATPFIETNIRSVYLHFFFEGRTEVCDKEILKLVEQTLPNKVRPFSRSKVKPCSVREWYNALMDYGAMLKKTAGNPNARGAAYFKQPPFKGSRRELRGEILRRAAKEGSVAPDDFKKPRAGFSVTEILSELTAEGFLRKRGGAFVIPN